jgi:hypothetical protein
MRSLGISVVVATIWISAATAATPAYNLPNPAAVNDVQAGTLSVASAAWWGFEAEDSTAFLQAALDSGAKKVVIPYMGQPWITLPLVMRGNQEIFLEPGVVVLAKKGEFKGKGDSVFRAVDQENITVSGYGATIRMHKRDYQQPPYEKAEWRMGLSFNGCTNIRVEGLRIESTGGDGIYIGTTGRQEYCKDVVIRDVVCFDNHRQGISVIGAENLLIENSTFASTWGTAPSAGIDLEPDSPTQRLVNIVVRNCIFEDNEGHEVLVYGKNLDESAPPISIRFENCIMRKTTLDNVGTGFGRDNGKHGWAGISVGAIRDNGPGGLIEFVDCTVDTTGKESVKIYDKSADKTQVRFVRCKFKDPWNVHHSDYADARVPIFFEVRRPYLSERIGGVEFVDCHLWDSVPRPVISMAAQNSEYGLHNVTGRIWIHGPHEPKHWVSRDSTGIELEFPQVKQSEPAPEREADADAE